MPTALQRVNENLPNLFRQLQYVCISEKQLSQDLAGPPDPVQRSMNVRNTPACPQGDPVSSNLPETAKILRLEATSSSLPTLDPPDPPFGDGSSTVTDAKIKPLLVKTRKVT